MKTQYAVSFQYVYTNKFGSKFYYKDKEHTILHREDGHAIEYIDGTKEWYLNGKRVSKEDAEKFILGYCEGINHLEFSAEHLDEMVEKITAEMV